MGLAALMVALALALPGCGLRTLKRDLEFAHAQASVAGRVDVRGGGSEPVVVVGAF
jgi:hypothetical protein